MGSPVALARLQRQLSEAFTDPKGTSAHLPRLKRVLVDAPPLPLGERLGIYSYAYAARLLEALEADFTRTRKALGERRFRKLAREYLERHPSGEWTVSYVGRHLPSFLKKKLEGKAARAVAMAWLDWAETLSFFALNEEPWDLSSFAQTLAAAPAEKQARVRLRLSASAILLGAREGFAKKPMLVWRSENEVRTRALSVDQAKLIEAFKKKRPLSAALSKLSPRAQTQAASWIQDWASMGLFSAARI